MHLVLGLLFALIACVAKAADDINKNRKIVNYQKSCAPSGALTEYNLCLKYWKEYEAKCYKDAAKTEMEIREWLNRYGLGNSIPAYFHDMQCVETFVTIRARVETAQQGKAPLILTHNTAAPFPIPDGYSWAGGIGQTPMTVIKIGNQKLMDQQREIYADMERQSLELAREKKSNYV